MRSRKICSSLRCPLGYDLQLSAPSGPVAPPASPKATPTFPHSPRLSTDGPPSSHGAPPKSLAGCRWTVKMKRSLILVDVVCLVLSIFC